jgi:hypothetical protein
LIFLSSVEMKAYLVLVSCCSFTRLARLEYFLVPASIIDRGS